MKNFSFINCSTITLILILGISSVGFSAESVKFDNEIKQGLTAPIDISLGSNGQILVLDSSGSVSIFDGQGKEQSSFTTKINAANVLATPSALAVTANGRVVICDSANSRIDVFNLIGEILFSFGTPGSLSGQFKLLSSVDVDSFGFIYAADHDNKRLQIFSPNGIFMKIIDLSGPPVDVAVDRRGNIYALIPEQGKIEKFSSDGKKIADINCQINDKNQLLLSSSLQVDIWGNIYLTQSTEEHIIKIDQSGNVLIAFGSQGNLRGQFSGIAGIASDHAGNVFVADSANARIQIFKITGPKQDPLKNLATMPLFLDFESTIHASEGVVDLFSLPGKGLFSVSDKLNSIGIWKGSTSEIGSQGAGGGQLSKPSAIYVTLDSRIFVADTANNRIQIFNYDGTLNYEFGMSGNKPGQFNSPQGIAVNSKGMIFVADTLNNRIQVFNQDGIYLRNIDKKPLPSNLSENEEKPCQLASLPKALALDTKDQLYVIDADSTQIKVFDENGVCVKSLGEKDNPLASFSKIVDIAFDENDNLYVADSADARVRVFDPKWNFLIAFGAGGIGNGYFKQLSALAVSEGHIFVADYQSNNIQVFKYVPDGLFGKSERISATKTAPPQNSDGNEALAYSLARKIAFNDAMSELVDSLGFSNEYLMRFVRIDSIESLNDGQVKVTISIPKFIPKEIKPVENTL